LNSIDRDVEFIGPDVENGIVELARELERPERGALLDHGVRGRRRWSIGAAQRDGREPRIALELDRYRAVLDPVRGVLTLRAARA
jgi:hypothetical protein